MTLMVMIKKEHVRKKTGTAGNRSCWITGVGGSVGVQILKAQTYQTEIFKPYNDN